MVPGAAGEARSLLSPQAAFQGLQAGLLDKRQEHQYCIEQRIPDCQFLQLHTLAMSEEAGQQGPLEDLVSELISVTDASEVSGLTPGYIRRLLRNGQIRGIKIGRDWRTTEEAVREYLKQERRPGPKREEE